MFFTFSADFFLPISSAFLVLLRIERHCCHEFPFGKGIGILIDFVTQKQRLDKDFVSYVIQKLDRKQANDT